MKTITRRPEVNSWDASMTITMLVCLDYLLSQNYLLHLSSNMSRESLKRIRSGLIVLFGLLLLYVMLCIYTDDIDTERNTISHFGTDFHITKMFVHYIDWFCLLSPAVR